MPSLPPGRYNMKVDVWKYTGLEPPILQEDYNGLPPPPVGLQPGFEVLATDFYDLFAVIAARRAIYEQENEVVRRRAETAKAIQSEADQKYIIDLFGRAASILEHRARWEDNDGMVTFTRYANIYGSSLDDLRAGGGCTYSTPEEAISVAKEYALATGVPVTIQLPRRRWDAIERKTRRR